MDQIKIGRFIAECRKENGITQMQLAEKLGITDRAVSKWETGKSMPDASIMLALCGELKITVNDLLNGEKITMENYNEKAEQMLLEMAKQKEEADRRFLSLEILIGIFSVILLLGCTGIAAFVQMESWARAVLIVAGFVLCLTGCGFCLRIEQIAGYYECAKCHHKYIPAYKSVLWAMHVNRTRYMKCPKCGRYSWNKKRLTRE